MKHYDIAGHAHELTFSTHQRRPLLTDPERIRIVLDAIARACPRLGFRVLAYVVMPEHVHLLVFPSPNAPAGKPPVAPSDRLASERMEVAQPPSVSSLLYAIKRPSSERIRRLLVAEQAGMMESLIVRDRPGSTVFRFWQPGSGYDRNIKEPGVLRAAIDYIHANPVRRGLCERPEQFQWSSAEQWLRPDSPCEPWMPVINRAFAC